MNIAINNTLSEIEETRKEWLTAYTDPPTFGRRSSAAPGAIFRSREMLGDPPRVPQKGRQETEKGRSI